METVPLPAYGRMYIQQIKPVHISNLISISPLKYFTGTPSSSHMHQVSQLYVLPMIEYPFFSFAISLGPDF